MRLHVVGTLTDVTGFALAGATGTVCATETDVTAGLRSACEDTEIALILVSAEAAGLAPLALQECQTTRELPIVLQLTAGEPPGSTNTHRSADDENPG